jgi:hypothetical protein
MKLRPNTSVKKTISSRNSNSTAYRVQYLQKQVFQETRFLVFFSVHCISHGDYGPFLSFSISHLRINETPRLIKIRFLISDGRKLLHCYASKIMQPSTTLNMAA